MILLRLLTDVICRIDAVPKCASGESRHGALETRFLTLLRKTLVDTFS